MKLALIGALALFSFQTTASCYSDYQNSLVAVEQSIKDSDYDEAHYEGMGLAGGLALSTTASNPASGITLFSTVAAGTIAAVYIGDKWIDYRIDENTEKLDEKRELLKGSIALLKEARTGSGPYLQGAMPKVWEEVSTHVSLGQVADTVLILDRNARFCQNGRVASPAGILKLTIEELNTK